MTYEEAFRKMAKAWFEGEETSSFNSSLGTERKYTKKYFDRLEREFGLSGKKAKDEPEDDE